MQLIVRVVVIVRVIVIVLSHSRALIYPWISNNYIHLNFISVLVSWEETNCTGVRIERRLAVKVNWSLNGDTQPRGGKPMESYLDRMHSLTGCTTFGICESSPTDGDRRRNRRLPVSNKRAAFPVAAGVTWWLLRGCAMRG